MSRLSNLITTWHRPKFYDGWLYIVYLLETRKNLDILQRVSWNARSIRHRERLPSWVPCWDGNQCCPSRCYFDPHRTISTTVDEKGDFEFPEDGSVLCVRGEVVCRAKTAGRTCNVRGNPEELKGLLSSWENDCLLPFCQRINATVDEVLPMWIVTLIHPHGSAEPDPADEWLYRVLMGHEPLEWLDEVERAQLEVDLLVFSILLCSRLSHLTMFLAENRWFRLSYTVIPDDSHYVCVFKGSQVPFIVREVGEGFFVGGPCFVWVIMKDIPIGSFPSISTGSHYSR